MNKEETLNEINKCVDRLRSSGDESTNKLLDKVMSFVSDSEEIIKSNLNMDVKERLYNNLFRVMMSELIPALIQEGIKLDLKEHLSKQKEGEE